MTDLPSGSTLVRTWFGDDRAWGCLVREVLTPSNEGFLAYSTPVNDPEFEGLDPEGLRARQSGGAIVSFLADEVTLTDPEHPILAVWVLPPQDDDHGDRLPFRVVPDQLWNVENNINLSNMSWEDFTDRVGADGVYRGEVVARESDYGFDVRSIMAQRLAYLRPGAAESIRSAESTNTTPDMAIISREQDPRSIREQLAALRSYPAALSWHWVTAFDAEHADDNRADYIAAFLEEIGEHASALDIVLASLSSGEDYYLVFVTPTQFDELSRLFTEHRMPIEDVRRGRWTHRITPEQSAAIRAWALTHGSRITARGTITWIEDPS